MQCKFNQQIRYEKPDSYILYNFVCFSRIHRHLLLNLGEDCFKTYIFLFTTYSSYAYFISPLFHFN